MISISICCGEKMAVMSFWPFHDDSQTDLNHGGFRKRRNCQNTITLAAFCPLECQHDSWEISRWIAQGRLRWSVHHRKKKQPTHLSRNVDFEPCNAASWWDPSIRDRVLRSGMLLYLHHRNSKLFFHPAKFDNFKDEKISDFKTVSVSQSKNLLDWKLVV